MSNLVLKVWSDNENWNADVEFARVTLSVDLVREWLRRIHFVRTAFAGDQSFHEATFYAFILEWCSYPDPALADQLEQEKIEELESVVCEEECGIVEPDLMPAIPEDAVQSTEYEKMAVSASGIRWTCSPRHGEITLSTAEVTHDFLVDWLDQRAPAASVPTPGTAGSILNWLEQNQHPDWSQQEILRAAQRALVGSALANQQEFWSGPGGAPEEAPPTPGPVRRFRPEVP